MTLIFTTTIQVNDTHSSPFEKVYLENSKKGLLNKGGYCRKREGINNLRFADDTVLLASTQEDLQIIVDSVHQSCKKAGVHLNTKKTKVLVISK